MPIECIHPECNNTERSVDVLWRHFTEAHPDFPMSEKFAGNSLTFYCDECGKKDRRSVSQISTSDRSFCSIECLSEAGENDDDNRHGFLKDPYGPAYRKGRRERLEIDDWECHDCGFSNRDHHIVYGRALECHHVKPVREFDEVCPEMNDVENLRMLCRQCHTLREMKLQGAATPRGEIIK